jgi:hypothetical protein
LKIGYETGLLLTMHNEINGAIKCVESYKNHFNNNIKIIGNDAVALGKVSSYFNIESKYSHNTIDRMHEVEKISYKVEFEELSSIVIDLLENYYHHCSEIKAHFIISLHPDHLIYRSYKHFIGRYDLEMNNVNRYDSKFKHDFRSITGFSIGLSHFGLPSYLNRDKLLKTIEFVRKNNYSFLNKLVAKNPKFIYEDSLLPTLFEYQGYRVGCQSISFEMGRKQKSIIQYYKFYLLHQVPENFNLPKVVKMLVRNNN